MTIGTAAGGSNWPGGSMDRKRTSRISRVQLVLTTIGLIDPRQASPMRRVLGRRDSRSVCAQDLGRQLALGGHRDAAHA